MPRPSLPHSRMEITEGVILGEAEDGLDGPSYGMV